MATEIIERNINTPLELKDYNTFFKFKKKGKFPKWKDLFHWISNNPVLVDVIYEHLEQKIEKDRQGSGQIELSA